MSLHWQMPENSSKNILGYKTRYEGKEEETQHPVLHRLIFLTMTLNADLNGNEKEKADVKRRVKYISKVSPDLIILGFGRDADKGEVWDGNKWVPFLDYFDPSPRYGKGGALDGWEVKIDDKWIDTYWGLSTNADRRPFKKWFIHFNQRTLEMMERGW